MAARREGKEARWRGKTSGCSGEMTGLQFDPPPHAEFGDFLGGFSGVAAKWARERTEK